MMHYVKSTGGVFRVNHYGKIIEYIPEDDTPERDKLHLASITLFDFSEWHTFYAKPMPETLDILDLGYWRMGLGVILTPIYVEPDMKWRKIYAAL